MKEARLGRWHKMKKPKYLSMLSSRNERSPFRALTHNIQAAASRTMCRNERSPFRALIPFLASSKLMFTHGRNERSPFRALTHHGGVCAELQGFRRNERSPFRALTHRFINGFYKRSNQVEMKEARLGRWHIIPSQKTSDKHGRRNERSPFRALTQKN